MEKGFTIELYNNTNTEKEIQLFTQDGLPEGVSAKVFNTELDYHNLLSKAKIEGFMGSGLQVDTDLIDHLIIHDEENIETIGFKRILYPKEIKLNGVSKYICLSIPPQVLVLVQFLPVL